MYNSDPCPQVRMEFGGLFAIICCDSFCRSDIPMVLDLFHSLYEMDAIDKVLTSLMSILFKPLVISCKWQWLDHEQILSGYHLPCVMFFLWSMVALIIYAFQWYAHRRLSAPTSKYDRQLQEKLMKSSTSTVGDDDCIVNEDTFLPHSRTSAHVAANRIPCCAGFFFRPSIELILLHTALFSYSAIVKTTSTLLQCRVSPLDDDKLVMYMAGKLSS
jgi:hypothetical protein